MEDIRIYDFDFKLRYLTNRFTSSNWTVKYNDIGTYEGHFPITDNIVSLVEGNPYLIIKQGEKTAIITGRQAANDYAVFGRTCNWILSKRTTPKFSQLTGTVESLTRGFVQTAFSDVNNFVLGELTGLTKSINFGRNTRNSTFDVVKECLENDGAGHEVIFDIANKQWVYKILKGKELPLIVSEANKNAYDTEFSGDCLDYCTCGWYEEQQEAVTAEEGSNETPEPIWKYIENDSTKKGIYRWECVLSGSNESEAKTSMETKKIKNVTAFKSRNLICGRDYRLGDIVRVQIQKGEYQITVKKRITGVNSWYEQGNIGEQPIFEDYKEE